MTRSSLAWMRQAGVVVALTVLLVADLGKTARARMFYLERPRLGTELEYAFQQSDQNTPFSRTQGTSDRFTEGLLLATRGFAYHPALFIFDLDLNPKWEQQTQAYDPGQNDSRRSFFLDYGIDGTLLPQRPISVMLLARHNSSTNTTSLASATTGETTLYGASLLSKSKKIPTRLSYTSSERIQEGFYPSTETSDSLSLASTHRSSRYFTNLNADYEMRQRNALGLAQNMDNASARLHNDLQVTDDRRVRLASGVITRAMDTPGLTTSLLDLSEVLNWQHTPEKQRLQVISSYVVNYTANRRDDYLSESMPLAASLTVSHRLYENLVSSLSGNGGHNRFTGGSEDDLGGRLNFDYSRRVPKGLLNLDLGHAYQVRDRTITTDVIDAFDEPQTLSASVFTLLANRHVDLATIRVFNADKSREYVLNFDYTVKPVGDFVQIERMPLGGLISDGQPVLVSYRYQSDPSAKMATLTRSFGTGLSLWSVLPLRYYFTLVQEELLGGLPPETLVDDTLQSYSAQLGHDWSSTLVTLDDEQHAAGNSRRSWKVAQDFHWRLRANLTLGVGGSYGESELLESASSGRAYSLRTTGQYQPDASQNLRLEMFTNTSTTDSPTRNESFGLGLFYVYRFGVWSVQADYRYLSDQQPIVAQEHNLNALNLTLRRNLY